jgi:hypothetical protein
MQVIYDAHVIAGHLTYIDFELFKRLISQFSIFHDITLCRMTGRDFVMADSKKRLQLINQSNLVRSLTCFSDIFKGS